MQEAMRLDHRSIAVLAAVCLLAGSPFSQAHAGPDTPPPSAPASALADSLLTHAEGVDDNDEGLEEVVVTRKHIQSVQGQRDSHRQRSRRHRERADALQAAQKANGPKLFNAAARP
jgi:hypothetical protein